jgi:hypothetical protein
LASAEAVLPPQDRNRRAARERQDLRSFFDPIVKLGL